MSISVQALVCAGKHVATHKYDGEDYTFLWINGSDYESLLTRLRWLRNEVDSAVLECERRLAGETK